MKSPFSKFGPEIKMEKPIFKKNVHLSQKEKQYVARLIEDGGTLAEISKWHKTRFGKPIATSKYYHLKSHPTNYDSQYFGEVCFSKISKFPIFW